MDRARLELVTRTKRQLAESRLRIDADIGDIVRIHGGIGTDAPVKGDAVALAITAADKRKTCGFR
jgi:hypothetical protein